MLAVLTRPLYVLPREGRGPIMVFISISGGGFLSIAVTSDDTEKERSQGHRQGQLPYDSLVEESGSSTVSPALTSLTSRGVVESRWTSRCGKAITRLFSRNMSSIRKRILLCTSRTPIGDRDLTQK